MSATERDEAVDAERRAIDAAVRVAGGGEPLGDHPAHRSSWRRAARREAIDSGMDAR